MLHEQGLPDELFAEYAPQQAILDLHRHQSEVFFNRSKHKCVLAGRQSGKSHLDAIWLLGGEPGQYSLYFAKTIKSAWSIMYSVFAELNATYKLGLTVKKGSGEIIEPNGHIIRVHGVKDVQAADNLRGQRFRRIVGDEAGVFESDLLKYTIEDILQPTLLKSDGSMLITGTPGRDGPDGYFFDLCGDPYSGVQGRWPTFHWTYKENPWLPPGKTDEFCRNNGWDENHPTFQREYLARWVVDKGARIYKWDGVYTPAVERGLTVLAIDFGYFPDATAFIVLRQSERPRVHVVRAFALNHLSPQAIAKIVSDLKREYHPNYIVADQGALGVALAAQMTAQFGIVVEKAKKQDKRGRIELLRGYIGVGNLDIAEEAAELPEEWKQLTWSMDHSTHHEKCKDDLTDACLYGLDKMLAMAPNKIPVDPRPAHEIEREQLRKQARARAERMQRGI